MCAPLASRKPLKMAWSGLQRTLCPLQAQVSPPTTTCSFLMVLVHGSNLAPPDASPDLPFYPSQVTTLTGHQAYPAVTGLWADKQLPLCHQKSQASSLPRNGTLHKTPR